MNCTELLHSAERDDCTASLDLTADWLQGRTAFGAWQAAVAVQAVGTAPRGRLRPAARQL